MDNTWLAVLAIILAVGLMLLCVITLGLLAEMKESFRIELNNLIRHGDRIEDRIAELEAKNGAAQGIAERIASLEAEIKALQEVQVHQQPIGLGATTIDMSDLPKWERYIHVGERAGDTSNGG